MADIFISYKRERRAAADYLAEILTGYGYSVWWDYDLYAGVSFGPKIERELRSAKAVIVLWCSLSVESDWVHEEANVAKTLNRIVPVKIEACYAPLGFTMLQTHDLSAWNGAPQGELLDRLLRDIARQVGRPVAPNMEKLAQSERAWRRFGALPLAKFALTSGASLKLKGPLDDRGAVSKAWDLVDMLTHEGAVKTAVVSKDGRTILTASADTTARLWTVDRHTKERARFKHKSCVYSAAFAPDEASVVTACGGPGTKDWIGAQLWDRSTGRVIKSFEGHAKTVRCAAFSPDGRTIITASDDCSVRTWDVASARAGSKLNLPLHSLAIRCAQYFPLGSRFATASAGHSAGVWDAQTGRNALYLSGHEGELQTVAIAPQGDKAVTASNDKTARIWDSATGQLLVVLTGHEGAVRSAQFSPDGRRVVTASEDRTARVWETDTGRCLAVIDGFREILNQAQFFPDGERIITACADGTANIWSEQKGGT